MIGAGWRRASRLTGHNALIDAPRPAVLPLVPGAEPPVALESLDSSASPDQPPSSPDSPATKIPRPWLSASDPSLFCLAFRLPAHVSAATSGCEALPDGLTR